MDCNQSDVSSRKVVVFTVIKISKTYCWCHFVRLFETCKYDTVYLYKVLSFDDFLYKMHCELDYWKYLCKYGTIFLAWLLWKDNATSHHLYLRYKCSWIILDVNIKCSTHYKTTSSWKHIVANYLFAFDWMNEVFINQFHILRILWILFLTLVAIV